jgi:ATP-dependent exoDNAse (exonuclease V) beta subunit
MSVAEPVRHEVVDDLEAMVADGPRRIPATAAGSLRRPDAWRIEDVERSSIEGGVLVHRALETGTDDLDALLRDDERARVEDVPALLANARTALAGIRAHPDIAAIFADSTSVIWRRHEVPFSWRSPDGTIVRGRFDCLVEWATGVVEILEFKTGQPTSEHQRQLEIYVAAAQAVFPTRSVRGRLIYSRQLETTFDPHVRLS